MSGGRTTAGNALRAWRHFVGERFPPATNGLMALCFALGNLRAASALGGVPFPVWRAPFAVFATTLFFFRLRCFDEIKDVHGDLVRHPQRPLARGLLTPRQVKRTTVWLALVELLAVAPLGARVWTLYALAMGYSLLMYREFFLGAWLRARLTLYAVSHTAVAVLLGWALVAWATDGAAAGTVFRMALVGLVNWLLFNIFEFGRKSFAPSEERRDEASYSSLYGVWGAVVLCLSQVVGAVAITSGLFGPRTVQGALATALVVVAAFYGWRATPPAAKTYRLATGVYVVVFYLALFVP